MFALGCIIYECVRGEKLFAMDGTVFAYAARKDEFFTERWPESPPDTPLYELGKLTKELIGMYPAQRPAAVVVKRRVDQIYRGAYREIAEESTIGSLPTPEPLQFHQPTKPKIQPLFQQASKRKRESSSPKLGPARQRAPLPPLPGEMSRQITIADLLGTNSRTPFHGLDVVQQLNIQPAAGGAPPSELYNRMAVQDPIAITGLRERFESWDVVNGMRAPIVCRYCRRRRVFVPCRSQDVDFRNGVQVMATLLMGAVQIVYNEVKSASPFLLQVSPPSRVQDRCEDCCKRNLTCGPKGWTSWSSGKVNGQGKFCGWAAFRSISDS